MDRENILKKVIEKLKKHREVIRVEHAKWDRVLDIERGRATRENLTKIFRISAPAKARVKIGDLRQSVKEFDERCDEIINYMSSSEDDAKTKHEWLLGELTGIRGVGTKIACDFLEHAVYWDGIWPELRDELYVPVDRHIYRIMTEKLKVFSEDEVPLGKPYKSRRFIEFQEALSKVHMPRVEFDFLWFIGSQFKCAYGIYCEYCWIKCLCRAPAK
jgi:endonuclease III